MTQNPISNIPPIGPMSGQQGQAGPVGPFKPVDPVKLFRQHMWLLIITGVIGILAGGGLYVALRMLSPQYTSQALLHVDAPLAGKDLTSSVGSGGGGSQAIAEIESHILSEIQRIKSDEVIQRVLNRDRVLKTAWFRSFKGDQSLEAARRSLQENTLSASSIRGAPLIRMSMKTANTTDAPIVLEEVIEVYLDELEDLAKARSQDIHGIWAADRAQAEREVDQLQEDINRFTRENDIDALNERNTAVRLEFENLSRQRLALQYALNDAQAHYSSLKLIEDGGGEPTADQIHEVMARPAMIQRQQEVNSLKSAINALIAGGYGLEHRAVKRSQEQLDSLEAELKADRDRLVQENMDAQLSAASRGIDSLQAQLAAMIDPLTEARQRLTDVRAKLDEYEAKKGWLEEAEEKYKKADAEVTMLRRYQEDPRAVRVSWQARPSEAELTFPKPAIVIPGVTILLLGAVTGLLFLREMIDQRMRSPADVKLLANVTMLGMLPDTSEDPSGATRIERVVERQPAGLMAESFRQVRTAILSRMDRRGYKSLMICSGQPSSGATSVAQNLAASVALNGRRVLLVDTNFRRPGQNHLCGVDNRKGLADVLRGLVAPDDVIFPIEGMTLSVMPTGQAVDAPPELLEGQAFRSLMARLEAAFDLIVIDAPPTLLASESQLLAKQVDAIAMVTRAGVDKRGMIDRMARQLDGQRADVLGVILNGVRSAAGGYFRKSYEEFYRYRQPAKGVPIAPAANDRVPMGHEDDVVALSDPKDDDRAGR